MCEYLQLYNGQLYKPLHYYKNEKVDYIIAITTIILLI